MGTSDAADPAEQELATKLVMRFFERVQGALRFAQSIMGNSSAEPGDERYFLFFIRIKLLDDKLEITSIIETLERLKNDVEHIIMDNFAAVSQDFLRIWQRAREVDPELVAA